MRREISSKKSRKMRFSEKRPHNPFFMISPFLKPFFISFFICKFRTLISSTLALHLSLPFSDRTNRLLDWLICLFVCIDCPFLLRHHHSRPHRLASSMSMTPGSLFMCPLLLSSSVTTTTGILKVSCFSIVFYYY